MTEPAAERVGIADLQAIVHHSRDFWGERDVSALHHALHVHEFGETSVLFRDDDGSVAAYLLGFVNPERVASMSWRCARIAAVRVSHGGCTSSSSDSCAPAARSR